MDQTINVMSESILQTISSLKVSEATFTTGAAEISFENGATLVIYNRFTLTGISPAEAKSLIGKTVSHIDDSPQAISIEFEKRIIIKIDMRDNAYTGPEAMELSVPGEPVAIWN
ncbi:hypothetical protein D9M70_544560 [compost metagenome]